MSPVCVTAVTPAFCSLWSDVTTMRNYHNSIYGVHRSEKATFMEIAKRYFWPGMYEDVREYISNCDVCQLGKGGCPTRQGMLNSRHYSHAFCQLCMDLIGPINQDSGQNDKYLLVILDPFSHFIWIELIETKEAKVVADAFVNRVLLEEGAPRAVLTDNGTEFKNKFLCNMMEHLQVDHQFSPPYHPQSNQTERANRFIVETLRAMVNEPGARKRDWTKYVKYIEFAMRRMPIPGTNLSPFVVMRGREPNLPIDSPLFELHGEEAPPDKQLSEHVNELKSNLSKAEKLVKSAREKVLAKNKASATCMIHEEVSTHARSRRSQRLGQAGSGRSLHCGSLRRHMTCDLPALSHRCASD